MYASIIFAIAALCAPPETTIGLSWDTAENDRIEDAMILVGISRDFKVSEQIANATVTSLNNGRYELRGISRLPEIWLRIHIPNGKFTYFRDVARKQGERSPPRYVDIVLEKPAFDSSQIRPSVYEYGYAYQLAEITVRKGRQPGEILIQPFFYRQAISTASAYYAPVTTTCCSPAFQPVYPAFQQCGCQ